jgi:tyrosyl-tRNA synthetase
MYGKAMSIPDALLQEWATLTTRWCDEERKAWIAAIPEKPMDVKKAIAFNIVEQYHDTAAAERGAQHFYNNVQNRDVLAKDYEQRTVASLQLGANFTLMDVCKVLEPEMTGGDLKRLITQGGVAVNGEKAANAQETLQAPFKIKIGKRGFYEVV